ncbi:FAD-binding protein, inferred for ABFAE pathway [Acidisarcina polymorpha]|uniref:FAD-binding protein, inferred for ABFAE pathway n=1 Tax=Acidisarcina polymorpha TaxID=2211140 RepID=A0A2Z5FYJ7_9BACT|nr:tryptophan 7-halogenase [Acidisarcina polymorpha]AXC11949.1 FAD-binding protein, inferred for ABFAE pathway [Acidisarcina polymorpha]
MQDKKDNFDVTVIGGGLAGMSASIHLANAGLRVLCIEADPLDKDPVGESLDWSAPDLLKALGLPTEYLLDQGIATYKRHVILKLRNGLERHYVPGEWLGKPPYNVNLRTLHVDRSELNQALREIFIGKGITLINDRVAHVETTGRVIKAVVTAQGERITSKWFIDASGSSAGLFPRTFNLPVYEYGPHKVAMWDYFTVPESIEGTTLHADGAGPPYMEWVWQIPIHPTIISVGYVTTGEAVKEKRQQGLSVGEIFAAQLQRFPDLQGFLHETGKDQPRTTSFRCRVFAKVAGPNWLVAGEAAAMVDPMTSNGVTAALRHGAEASSLIIQNRNRERLPRLAAAMYSQRVLSLARFFNSGIENVLYDWPIRNRIGAFNAGDLYTIPAWSMNVVYSRLRPQGLIKTTLLRLLLATLRYSLDAFHWFCKRTQSPPAAATAP